MLSMSRKFINKFVATFITLMSVDLPVDLQKKILGVSIHSHNLLNNIEI
jgi:hypothetical protein